MRLKIELFPNWAQHDNPDGPATFCRTDGAGAFQVSWAEHTAGKPPNIAAESCLAMAKTFGEKNNLGELIESNSGSCRYGLYGTATFRSDRDPRIQIWFISDGTNCIMATHVCNVDPDAAEVTEAQQIASTLALGQ